MPENTPPPDSDRNDIERDRAISVNNEIVPTVPWAGFPEADAIEKIGEASALPVHIEPSSSSSIQPRAAVAQRAEPFTMVSRDEAFSLANSVRVAEIRVWLERPREQRRLLFDDCREECPEVAIVRNSSAVPATLWVVGDIHADVLALANIIAHADRVAETEKTPASFLFLGDFVDRGRHDHETLLLLFKLATSRPERVCIIPGNHDIDLRWDESARRFRVSIEPAEYCEWLNGVTTNEPADREEVELAKLFVRFCQERPKAVILPDGALFAHGGFPHTDTLASLNRPQDLADPKCLSDFLWARLSESPKKRPNRGNRGHEFGWRDFAQFCQTMAEVVKVPVRRLVRGHDHYVERWRCHAEYAESPVLTLNAMSRCMEGEPAPSTRSHPYPVVARYVRNQLPEVFELPLSAAEVDRAFELDRESPAHSIEEFLAPNVDYTSPGNRGHIDSEGER